MEPHAHSPSNKNPKFHGLEEHLWGTAKRTEAFTKAFGFPLQGRILGGNHDFGKFNPDWQVGLVKSHLHEKDHGVRLRIGIDHKNVAALAFWTQWEKDSQESKVPFSLILSGHHGGLENYREFKERMDKLARDGEYKGVMRECAQWAINKGLLNSNPHTGMPTDPYEIELLTRFFLSALVDGDWSDTSAHAHPRQPRKQPGMKYLKKRFLRYLKKLSQKSCSEDVREMRDEVLELAVRIGALTEEMFILLNAPTGSGKTMAALALAFELIEKGYERIFIVAPYNAILNQTAKDVEEALGTWGVARHYGEHSTKKRKDGTYYTDIGATTWDSPIVLTSMEQLADTLFDNTTGRLRKLHRLANSVVILDEVQTIPEQLLRPMIRMIRSLTETTNTVVISTTATQPNWGELEEMKGLTPLLISPTKRLSPRVQYHWLNDCNDLDTVAKLVQQHEQVLVVVNTTKDAAFLARSIPGALHLSARMHHQHRQEVTDEVNRRLAANEPVCLVATQVVEAGMDFDFPVGFRDMAPCSSLVQVAGRVNRHGQRQSGDLYIFDTRQEHRIQTSGYARKVFLTRKHFKNAQLPPDDKTATDAYWHDLLSELKHHPLSNRLEESRRTLDFPATAKEFNFVDSNTQPVVVDGGSPEVSLILDQFTQAQTGADAAGARNALGRFSVNLWPQELRDAQEMGFVRSVTNPKTNSAVKVYTGPYDATCGVLKM